MVARYAAQHPGRADDPAAPLHIVHGSDHALSDFDKHLPVLLRFLGLLQ